jgi:WD40 repeat protein
MLLLRTEPYRVHTLAFSPDGQSLASVSGRSPLVKIWDLNSLQLRAELAGGTRVAVAAFNLDADNPLVVACSAGGALRLWEPFVHPWEPGQPPVQLSAPAPWAGFSKVGHTESRLVFRPGSGVLTTNGANNYGLFHWHLPPARPRKAENWPMGLEVSCLAYSPGGHLLATGGFDRWVKLWGVADRQLQHSMDQGSKVHFLAFSPAGTSIASGSPHGLIKLWDPASGKKITTLKGEPKFLHGLCYSPDGQTVATASGEGVVRFWNVQTGRVRTGFNWGIGEVHCVAFSPDGMRAAAGGSAGEIVVWDIDDWEA